MKKVIHRILILLICVAVALGCSVNDSDIKSFDKLTVEGQIRENQFAEILLSNSLDFKGTIDSLTVAKTVESKATVSLSDGETSEILTLKRDNSRFPFLFYRSNIIKGDLSKKYTLSIKIRNKEFISETTVPPQPIIKEVTFIEAQRDGVPTPEFKDIRLEIVNNLSTIDYYKIFIKNENEEKFELARPFIINTQNIATETFPLIVNYATFKNGTRENLLLVNQTFEINLVAITKEQFNFWKSVEGEESDIIENSTFSSEVPTNISNGAFGYWSGENITRIKFKIPE